MLPYRTRLLMISAALLAAGVGGVAIFGQPGKSPGQVAPAAARVSVFVSSTRGEPEVGTVERAEQQSAQRTSTLDFGDGERISVRFKPRPAVSERKGATLLEVYAALRAAAEDGDGDAAFQLHRELGDCKRAYSNEADLAAAIELLQQTHQIKYADMSTPKPLVSDPSTDYEKLARDVLRKPYEYCKGITDEQKGEANRFLIKAANAGHSLALTEYARSLGDSPAAIPVWNRAWLQGDIWALGGLSKHLREPSPVGGKAPEPVLAHAYLLLHVRLIELVHGRETGPQPRMIVVLNDVLKRSSLALNPNDHETAVAMAKTLLSSNTNCCFEH